MNSMTPDKHASQLAHAKQEYENETRTIISRLERARTLVDKLEKQLAATQAAYYARINALSAAFLGLPLPPELDGGRDVKRKRRGLDPQILEFSKKLSEGGADFGASDLAEAWNREYPEAERITESTARGVLERLAAKGELRITQLGAGRGKGIPRKYTAA